MFAILLGAAFVILGLLPSDEVEAKRISLLSTTAVQATQKPSPMAEPPQTPQTPQTPQIEETKLEAPQPAVQTPIVEDWKQLTVKRGDTLSHLLARAEIGPRTVYELTRAEGPNKHFRRLQPGQQIAVQLSEEGELLALRHRINALETIDYQLTGDGYAREDEIRTPVVRDVYRQATLSNSLFVDAGNAGVPQQVILDMANVFAGVIDFVLDPRSGDTFSLLYQEQYLDGQKIGNGAILATAYVNQGKRYSAYRYIDEQGMPGYFDEHGVSMQKAFLRAPLDFTRVSSNFNLRRRHPVHKKIRAHRGVDYAAPTGTPVFAAGKGRVSAAGYSRANGNYVFIKHGERYQTKYLHLSKRFVKTGDRVTQKQRIGNVGATGLATGPHLHYEFLMDGVHRNPRTIIDKLPRAESIAKLEMPRYQDHIAPFQKRLANYHQAWLLAQAENTPEG